MMDHQQQRPLNLLLRTPESLALWNTVPRLPRDLTMDIKARKDHNQNHAGSSSDEEEGHHPLTWDESDRTRCWVESSPTVTRSPSPVRKYSHGPSELSHPIAEESDSVPMDLSKPSSRVEHSVPAFTRSDSTPDHYVCKKRKAMLNAEWRSHSESNIPKALGSKQARLDKLVSHLRKSNVKEATPSATKYDDLDDNSEDRPLRIVEDESASDVRHARRPEHHHHHMNNRSSNASMFVVRDEEETRDQDDYEEEPFPSSHLRRTASESVLPPAESLDEFRRHLLQYQLLQGMLPGAALSKQLEEAVGASGDSLSSLPSCPPWLYLSLYGYSHLLQSFQAQDFLRHVASNQASKAASSPSGRQSPSVPSPAASTSDEAESGPFGTTSGNLSNGKRRSPRALTGKHVRLGTGASPTTLQTLRMKIEERQRMKKMGTHSMAGAWSTGTGHHNKGKAKNAKTTRSRKK